MKKITAIFFILLFSVAAFGQVRTGNIYGTVVDESGARLPGVTVTLTSPVTAELVTITSEEGNFRFLALSPGKDYALKLELDGFKTEIRKGIRVIIGENVTLNFKLQLGNITETVEVTGKSPAIDVRKTTQATNVTQEILQSIPSARDPWVILQKAPSLMMDRENVGGNESGQQSSFSSRGEGRSNAQWNVDGVEVTDPTAPGTSGMYFDFDMFEEMQIQTAANDMTAMTGGVNINFVTKRGSDKLSGGGRFYWTDKELQANNTPSAVEQADLSGNMVDSILDYGFNIGGPIIRQKMWFWGSVGVQDISLMDMLGDTDATLLKTFNGKLNLHLGNHRIELYGVYNDKVKEGRKRYPLDTYEASRKQTGPAHIFKLQDEITVGNDLLISLKAAYTPTSYKLEPYGGRDVPVYEEYGTFRFNTGTWEEYETDIYSGSAQLTYFKEKFLGGDHEFKLGADIRYSQSMENSQLGNGLHGKIRPGKSLYYANLYREWLLEYKLQRFSAFFQDNINIGNVVLSVGVRYDHQSGGIMGNTIPGTNIDVASNIGGVDYNFAPINQPAADLPFDFNFLSPRVGFTWDVNKDGKTVVKGNFALYGSVLDAGYLSDTYLIDSYHDLDWWDDNGNQRIDTGELDFYQTRDNYAFVTETDPSFLFDENLSPEKDMEIVLGIERELSEDFAVGLNIIYRRLYDFNWQVPYVWDGGYRLVRNSDWQMYNWTVDGQTYEFWDTPDVYDEGIAKYTKRPDYSRTYTGFELTFNKRLSNRWMLNGSFTYQDTKVHYDSENAYIDPTDHKSVDKLDGKSGPHAYDNFVMNSRWMFKLNWLYRLPLDINFAGTLNVREGYILPTVRTLFDAGIYRGRRNWDNSDPVVLTETFGDTRYPTFFMLDLRLEKAFDLKKIGKIYITIDAFNVTNSNTTMRQGNDISLANYHVPIIIVNPRVFRFGLRYEF